MSAPAPPCPPTPPASPSGWSTGPPTPPTASSSPAATRGGDWRRVTYAEALAAVRGIGQALLDRGLSPERPVAILSGNGIEHALLGLAAMHVGVPYAPISPAYSLVSKDYLKLLAIIKLLRPGLVFAESGTAFAAAVAATVPAGTELVVADGLPNDRPATRFADLAATPAGKAVYTAAAAVGPDTVAKILFTSGSTGTPKGVINTQRMLCSNQEMLRTSLAFLADEPPVIVDWLPWNHTFGGNHNVGLVLYNGGTLYIDDGKPTPAGIAETVRNLREISPTIYFNVPKGFEELVTYLRAEPDLRRTFFRRREAAVLRRCGAGAACLGRAGRTRGRDRGRAHHHAHRPRRHRDRAVRHRLPPRRDRLGHRRAAGDRQRPETRADRRQAGGAAARPERHARLLAPGGNDRARPLTKTATTSSATR